jgi:hypothetical protein
MVVVDAGRRKAITSVPRVRSRCNAHTELVATIDRVAWSPLIDHIDKAAEAARLAAVELQRQSRQFQVVMLRDFT